MDGLEYDDLVIRVDRSAPACLRLDWLGRSNSRDPGQVVSPFLDKMLVEAGAHGNQLEMHFEMMEYFNSSTIVALIRVINAARKGRVTLRFHYDEKLKWQDMVFAPLKRAVASFDEAERPSVEFLGDHVLKH